MSRARRVLLWATRATAAIAVLVTATAWVAHRQLDKPGLLDALRGLSEADSFHRTESRTADRTDFAQVSEWRYLHNPSRLHEVRDGGMSESLHAGALLYQRVENQPWVLTAARGHSNQLVEQELESLRDAARQAERVTRRDGVYRFCAASSVREERGTVTTRNGQVVAVSFRERTPFDDSEVRYDEIGSSPPVTIPADARTPPPPDAATSDATEPPAAFESATPGAPRPPTRRVTPTSRCEPTAWQSWGEAWSPGLALMAGLVLLGTATGESLRRRDAAIDEET